MEVLPLPPDHPWYFLNQYGVPNVKWCEATVNSWISEPANTWSNLVYILIGALLLWSRRGKPSGTASGTGLYIRRIGWACVVLGFCSGIYHASSTFVLQIGDFFAMFLLLGLGLFLNCRRLGWVEERQFNVIFWPCVIVATAAVPFVRWMGLPIQEMVALVIAVLAGLELAVYLRGARPKYTPLMIAIVFVLMAGAASAADVTRIFCDPENHFLQGHALWHLFNAVSIYCYARYLEGVTLPSR